MQDLIKKANVLVEALPYIQKFRNSVMVIKFGGSSMEDPELVRSTMRDVVLLEATGIKPVVVHGGGKAISAELRKQDIPVRFVNGLRFTCDRTIRVVDDVLHTAFAGLEKIKKLTGLDLRQFDHAIIFKVALMVRKYLSSRDIHPA